MSIIIIRYPLGGGQFGTLFVGDPGNTPVVGTTGTDTFRSPLGNHTYDGGAGFDTVEYTKPLTAYQFSWSGTSLLVRDIATGETDTLKNIEQLTFAGVSIKVADL